MNSDESVSCHQSVIALETTALKTDVDRQTREIGLLLKDHNYVEDGESICENASNTAVSVDLRSIVFTTTFRQIVFSFVHCVLIVYLSKNIQKLSSSLATMSLWPVT